MSSVETIVESDDLAVVLTAERTFTPLIKQKVITFTRDLSLASGVQIITGLGFKPRLVLFQSVIFGGSTWMSTDMASSPQNQFCFEIGIESIKQGYLESSAGNQRGATSPNFSVFALNSFDPDGFTLQWTKVGSPVEIASIIAICFR